MRTWMVALTASVTLLASYALGQPPGGGQFSGGRFGGPPQGGPFDAGRNPLVRALDTNGDGELSAAELAAATVSLKKLDTNGDGRITRNELRGQFAGRGDHGGRPGMGPGMGMGTRPGMGPQSGGREATLAASTQTRDASERKVLDTLNNIDRTQGRMMNVPTCDGRMLRLLVESIGAKSVVEIGMSNGVSALWMSLGLRKTGGRLTTFEIDAERAALARQNFAAAGVADLISLVEGDAHQKVSGLKGPIDLVFIDADKEGYLDYFQKLFPLVRPGGLITAHNMNARMADQNFVKAITTDAKVETVFYTDGGGLSITLKKR
jgi:caffeoyl-CoA O-methyltransferase